MGSGINAEITLISPQGRPVGSIVGDGNRVTVSFNGLSLTMGVPEGARPTSGDSRPRGAGQPEAHGVHFRGHPGQMQASLSQVYGGATLLQLRADPLVAQALDHLSAAMGEGAKQTEVFLPARLLAAPAPGKVPFAPPVMSKEANPALTSHADPGTDGVSIRGTAADGKADSKTAALVLPEHVPAQLQKPLEACQVSLRQLAAIPEHLSAQLAAAANTTPLPAAAAVALNAAGSAFFAKPAAGTEASLMRALFVAGLVSGQEPQRLLRELSGLFAGQKPDLAILLRYAESRGATAEVLAQLQAAGSALNAAALKRERRPEEMVLDQPRDKRAEGKKATGARKRVEKLGGDGDGDGRQPFEEEELIDDEADTGETKL